MEWKRGVRFGDEEGMVVEGLNGGIHGKKLLKF